MMRILHILDKISYSSGVSNVILNYYFHMNHSEIVFDFFINEPIEQKELSKKIKDTGSNIYVTTPLCLKNLYRYERELIKFFNKHSEYKIVHGHMPNLAFIYLKIAKSHGVPIRILHCHTTKGGTDFWKSVRNNIFKEIGVNYATDFIACSKESSNYLLGNKKKECIFLKNAIDIQKFKYDVQKRYMIRGKLGIRNQLILGHIGRFSTEKNHIFLLEILEELIKIEVNVKLLLVGEGKLREEIEHIVRIKQMQDYVLVVGQQKEVGDYLCAMDLFLFPSLFEGSPVSLVEAQANGLNCLVSDRITNEINISSLIEYLPISSKKIWVEKILSFTLSSNSFRKSLYDELRNNGYDINYESIRLENIYKEIMRNYINEE